MPYKGQRLRTKRRPLRLERLESRVMLASDTNVAIELAILNLDGEPVSQVEIGDEFILQGRARDLRRQTSPYGGVFAADVDVTYGANWARATGEIRTTDGFPSLRSADLSALGLIDEVGGIPSKGKVTLGEDGSFVYRPRENFDGSDRFEYSIITEVFLVPMLATTVGETYFTISDVGAVGLKATYKIQAEGEQVAASARAAVSLPQQAALRHQAAIAADKPRAKEVRQPTEVDFVIGP